MTYPLGTCRNDHMDHPFMLTCDHWERLPEHDDEGLPVTPPVPPFRYADVADDGDPDSRYAFRQRRGTVLRGEWDDCYPDGAW